jgi:NADH-quinone oxidoreductase subunit G
MATVIVDGKEVTLADTERLNAIQAAQRAGVAIPHYCWHAGLSVVASCRMCLIEVGKKDDKTGKISMQPRLVPACQTPATHGTVLVTDSPKVAQARAMVEEDLLLRHPVDCPICDKAGECLLQDYHFQYGREQRRADIRPFTSRRRDLGPTITLFVDRCVMCSRCVRFTREISGTSELMVIHRGAHEEIDVFRDEAGNIVEPLSNKLAGNVVDLCPVGALGDKDFLYQQRVWFLKSHDHVCAGCATGCSIKVEENQDRIYRLKPRENPHVNQWWMCDEGRYSYHHVHSPQRQTQLRRRQGQHVVPLDWSALVPELDGLIRRKGRVAAALSPELTVEEAYLLASYLRQAAQSLLLAVGPVPVVGEDERFPSGFTIRAEKCPNRRGVELIADRLGGRALDWPSFLAELQQSSWDVVWLTGGYPQAWHEEATAQAIRQASGTLIVQDCFPSPLWDLADYQIPGTTFAEREGSFVNAGWRLQSFRFAVRPPSGVLPEAALYWQLLGRRGLYRATDVLGEVAREMAAFSAAAAGVPPSGIDLRVQQLAEPAPRDVLAAGV